MCRASYDKENCEHAADLLSLFFLLIQGQLLFSFSFMCVALNLKRKIRKEGIKEFSPNNGLLIRVR